MFVYLFFLPGLVSAILGVVYLFAAEASRTTKLIGAVVFFLGLYCQFQSPMYTWRWVLGLLVLSGLAVALALWRKLDVADTAGRG